MDTLNMLNLQYAVLKLSKCTEYWLYIEWKFAGGKAPAQVALPKPRSKSSLRLNNPLPSTYWYRINSLLEAFEILWFPEEAFLIL